MNACIGLSLALSVSLSSTVQAFYLPGVAPHNYAEGEDVELKVNKLSSTRTQIPHDYYSLKFCKPLEGIKTYSENLGEFLRGDRIENSAYEINMLETKYCSVLCQNNMMSHDVSKMSDSVKENYHHNWIMDNLPAATVLEDDRFVTTEYTGFPVGFQEGSSSFVYNHVNIIIDYHTVGADEYRIVGFKVEPISVKHAFFGGIWNGEGSAPTLATCSSTAKMQFEDIKKADRQGVKEGPIVYTYGVEWQPSEVNWASRWDVYLTMNDAVPNEVHWFSIINSTIIVLVLSFMLVMIIVRAIRHDINRYNAVPTDEEKAGNMEDTGWKLIHGDVFRPPAQHTMLFCVLMGTGCQLSVALFMIVIFCAIGFISPASRGSLMMGLMLLFIGTAIIAGFMSAKYYKSFKGKQWQRCTLVTAFFFPTFCFVILAILNIVVTFNGSTGAIPFYYFIPIMMGWYLISVPMVFMGAYLGYKSEAMQFPVEVSNIPREIPTQPYFLNPVLLTVLAGLLPFSASYVELFFVMSSLWMDKYYYVFGFLLLVVVIMLITTAEVSVMMCYLQINNEDHRWWWNAMLNGGSFSLYVFLYSISYFARLESNTPATYVLYFGYNLLVCAMLFMVTGAVGVTACIQFNKLIYGSIKVD